jgi:hypothetical protein
MSKQPILGRENPLIPMTGMKRLGTANTMNARPMTAVSGAGFSSKQNNLQPGTEMGSSGSILESKVETYERNK